MYTNPCKPTVAVVAGAASPPGGQDRTTARMLRAPDATVADGRGRPRRTGAADERVRRELFDAIIDHRIPPGTPLPEDTLAGAFGVSRTVVRKALLTLGHEKLVELRPNRGAVVARPTVEEARAVFEARRVLEAAIVEGAVARARDDELEAVR